MNAYWAVYRISCQHSIRTIVCYLVRAVIGLCAIVYLSESIPIGAQQAKEVIIVQQWAELPSERLLRDPNEFLLNDDIDLPTLGSPLSDRAVPDPTISGLTTAQPDAPVFDRDSEPFPQEIPSFSQLLGLEGENERLLRFAIIKSETQPMSAEIVSAIIYGYEFEFVPASPTRSIEEEWKLVPVALIDAENSQFTLLSAKRDERLLYTVFRFDVNKEQQGILDSWNNATALSGFGRGRALFERDGITTKRTALFNALKEAVFLRLKQQYPNAPRRVTGRVRLENPPLFTIIDSSYSTKADVEIVFNTVDAHVLF